MRPSLVSLAVSLLLLSLSFTGAQGIRFKKEILSFGQHSIRELEAEKSSLLKTSDADSIGDHDQVVLCKDWHCSSTTTTGMNRKLLITTTTTTSIPSPTTISKNEKMNTGENHKANPTTSKGKSSRETFGANHHNNDHYVDITDITEMDYSPARRKPPIHN